MQVRDSNIVLEAAPIAEVVNETWAYLRTQGVNLGDTMDWTRNTALGFQAANYRATVRIDDSARIDCVIWWRDDEFPNDRGVPEKWLTTPIVAVRYSTLLDTKARQIALFDTFRPVLAASVQRGCVGLRAEIPSTWTNILDVMKQFSTYEEVSRGNLVTRLTKIRYVSPQLAEFEQKDAAVRAGIKPAKK